MSDADLLARWDRLMQAVELPYARAIAREKNRYIELAAAGFPSHRKLIDREFHEHADMMQALAEHYEAIAIRIALVETFKDQKVRVLALERKEAWDKLWHYLVGRWLAEYGARAARETAQTTRDDLQRVIGLALSAAEEFNPVRVAADLLKVRGLSPFRAMTIATTETHNAMMFASHQGAEKISRDHGLDMTKRWVPVTDERTRANHTAMSGTPAIPMDADFTVGGEKMARPGDPRGSAANTVRCRCVLSFSVDG